MLRLALSRARPLVTRAVGSEFPGRALRGARARCAGSQPHGAEPCPRSKLFGGQRSREFRTSLRARVAVAASSGAARVARPRRRALVARIGSSRAGGGGALPGVAAEAVSSGEIG